MNEILTHRCAARKNLFEVQQRHDAALKELAQVRVLKSLLRFRHVLLAPPLMLPIGSQMLKI